MLSFLVPVGLVRDGLEVAGGGGPSAAVLGGLLVLAAGAVLILWARGGRPGATVGFALLATGLVLPAASLVSTEGAALEARFAYATATPLFLLGGLAVEYLVRWGAVVGAASWGRVRSAAGLTGAVVLLLALGASSWAEATSWRDDRTFHELLIRRHPESISLVVRYARSLRREAQAERRAVAGLPADDPVGRAALGRYREYVGQARGWAAAALERVDPLAGPDPWSAGAYRELGLALFEAGRLEEAAAPLADSLRLDPWGAPDQPVEPIPLPARKHLAEVHRSLGRIEHLRDQPARSAEHLLRATALDDAEPRLLEEAGQALLSARRYGEALRMLRRAADAAPDPETRARLVRDLESAQAAARKAAERHLRDARAAEEQDPPQYGEAAAGYEAAADADPTLMEAWYHAVRLHGVWFAHYAQAEALLARARQVLSEIGTGADDLWAQRFQDLEETLRRQKASEEEEERGGG